MANPAQRSGAAEPCVRAELDDRICGFVVWGASRDPDATRDTAEVYAIYLDPDAIGRGVGRSLFASAVDDIVAHGASAAILWVLDANERARRFYAAAGWHPDGATKTEERPGGTLHELAAWMLLALIGIHAAAALFHGLILRDGVLQRMLPWTGR